VKKVAHSKNNEKGAVKEENKVNVIDFAAFGAPVERMKRMAH
jgi:hypothetical protein